MALRDIMMLAKQGDPKAIATLLNHVIKSQGIKAQVVKRDDCLHILLESAQTLNQHVVVAFIQKTIMTLQVYPVSSIWIYGRHVGDQAIAWSEEIQLSWEGTPLFVTEPVSSHPDYQAPELEVASPSISEDLSFPDPSLVPLASASTSEMESQFTPSLESPVALTPISDQALSPSPSASLVTEMPPPEFSIHSTPADSEDSFDLLKRPEAVVLILFVSLIMLWQMYIDFLESADLEGPLSGRELARRLGVNNSTISRKKDRGDFSTWSQDLDPDGVAWVYQDGMFIPQLE